MLCRKYGHTLDPFSGKAFLSPDVDYNTHTTGFFGYGYWEEKDCGSSALHHIALEIGVAVLYYRGSLYDRVFK